jgi:8-oxo-dGTP pyrophosphatase MutT (NUDIX family)
LPQLEHLVLLSDRFRQLIPSKTPLRLLKYLRAALRGEDLEDVLANAPLLAELYWSRVSDGDLYVRRVRSDTLTKLELDASDSQSFSVDEFISILQSFPSLSHLSCSVFLLHIPHRTPLLFPNLRSLDLSQPQTGGRCHLVIHALELLVLPRLTHLRSDSPSLSLHPDAIRRFISRSACLIRELKCELGYKATSYVWDQLEMFTSLETLDITLDDYITPLFQELDTEPRPPKLPSLRHLTISYTGKLPIDYTHVIDIIQRRRAHTETVDLKSVHLEVNETDYDWWDCYPCRLVSAEFLRLVASGVDITISRLSMADDYEVVWPA